MLVLTRKIGESIVLNGQIVVKVSQINGNRVKLCVEAPKECRVVRSEILESVQAGQPGGDPRRSASEEKVMAAI